MDFGGGDPNKPNGNPPASLESVLEGFTGVKKGRDGHEYHYQDGKRVGGAGGKASATAKTAKPEVDYDSRHDSGWQTVPGFHKTRGQAEAAGDAVAKYPDSNLWVALKKPEAAAPLASLPTKEFAGKVQGLADAIPHAIFAGDNEVYISDVYNAVKKQDPAITLDGFKAKMLDSVRAGHVELGRLDSIEAGHPEDLKQSVIDTGNSVYHVMRVAPNKARTAKYSRDEIQQAQKAHTAARIAALGDK